MSKDQRPKTKDQRPIPKDQRPIPKDPKPKTWLLGLLVLLAFLPADRPTAGLAPAGACDPYARKFEGYTFVQPDIVQKNAAYAPFLLRWDPYYEQTYFSQDIQRQENVREWIERFCGLPEPEDVSRLVYEADYNTLLAVRNAAADPEKKTALPFSLQANTFAEVLAFNSCTEVIDYLLYAKRCEPWVVRYGDSWTPARRDTATMRLLIREGMGRFRQTESHFVRLRYAYQIVRLAHYTRDSKLTIRLFNELMPKVDRRKPSIVFFWTLGHLAGALQKEGRYAEAAYRYALIFRHCPSKRLQAFQSFRIRNDKDWDESLRLCRDNAEKATLYLLRAGVDHRHAVSDMEKIYELDPENPQLALLVVGDIQELEKWFLRTPVTDKLHGAAAASIRRAAATDHLLDLQKFVRLIVREGKQNNPALWRALGGYLELLAGDYPGAEASFNRAEAKIDDDTDNGDALKRQIAIWRLLADILKLDPAATYVDDAVFRLRSYELYQNVPMFEIFLQDYLSSRYAAAKRPGKALVSAYGAKAIVYNPRLDVLDDLLLSSNEPDPVFLEAAMGIDTNIALIKAKLLEIKGVHLFNAGQPEAALVTLRSIPPTLRNSLPTFSPFKEVTDERIHRPVTDTLLLNRLDILEKLIDLELRAKAASAVKDPVASWYYYLLGLGYYNMSYFGYEWEAFDFYRSGQNWARLQQGPVFPLAGSPEGNRENLDLSRALGYFERALAEAQTAEMGARAAFMAARCQQKQFFLDPATRYKPGSRQIPALPERYQTYYRVLIEQFPETEFFKKVVKECKWLEAYR